MNCGVKHGVVRLDDVRSIYTGHIHSVVYKDDILENGMIGVAGDLLPNERELKELKVPTGTSEPVVLIASPEIVYEQYKITDNALENFYIPVGEPARAYDLEYNDIFSVSEQMVKPLDEATGIVEGTHVTSANGSLLMTEIASPTGDEAFLAKVIQRESIGTTTIVGQAGAISRRIDWIVVRVIRNRA